MRLIVTDCGQFVTIGRCMLGIVTIWSIFVTIVDFEAEIVTEWAISVTNDASGAWFITKKNTFVPQQ